MVTVAGSKMKCNILKAVQDGLVALQRLSHTDLPLGLLSIRLGNLLQPTLHHVVPLAALTDVQDASTCCSCLNNTARYIQQW